MRTFVDDAGRSWTVWEVRPGLVLPGAGAERRLGRERRGEAAPDPVIERRRAPERRGGRRADARPRAAAVATPLADGWLTFQTDGDRRRLAPVPDGWEALPPPALGQLCRRAMPA